jgi:alpha-L-rhamnosidase
MKPMKSAKPMKLMNKKPIHLPLAFALACAPLLAQAPEMWEARWIWDAGPPSPQNYYLHARKSFDLDAAPSAAKLLISADSKYKLYVNGEFIRRGPARSDSRWQQYDEFDVRSKLRPGRNAIAVLVHHYGDGRIGFMLNERAGLICQLNLDGPSGKRSIASDGTWKVSPARAWSFDTGPSMKVGFPEIHNANLLPAGWEGADFDDSRWPDARPIEPRQIAWTLTQREIPMLVEKEIFPERVHRIAEVLNLTPVASGETLIAERMAREILEEPVHVKVSEAQNLLRRDGKHAVVENGRIDYLMVEDYDGTRDATIIVDFGRQINGFIRLNLEGHAGQVVDFAWSQRLAANQVPPVLRLSRNADRLILKNGKNEWESFEYKNFRYLQLTFRNLYRPLKIDSVSAQEYSYPAPVEGNFESSDPFLNWIWKAATRTTELSMDDGFMDNSYREKSQWYGDVSAVLLGTYAAMGNVPLVNKYFRDAQRGQLRDGFIQGVWPQAFPSLLPQEGLLYSLRLREHYELTGDLDILRRTNYPVLSRFLEWCRRHASPKGLLDKLPYWNWFDWSNPDIRGASFATNAVYWKCLMDGAYLARVLGYAADASAFEKEAAALRQELTQSFWDGQRGLYLDSLIEGKATGRVSEHSNYLALLFGLADGPRRDSILNGLLAGRERMARISPNAFYYLAAALAQAGKTEELLQIMRRRFGRMYREKSDTLWEDWSYNGRLVQINADSTPSGSVNVGASQVSYPDNFRPEDYYIGMDRSLAQGAVVCPSYVLSTEVLGIKPAKPGFETVRLEPKLGGLAWAKGTFPSVRGPVGVDWKSAPKEFRIETRLPSGSAGELVLPMEAGRIQSVTLNGVGKPLSSLRLAGGPPLLDLPSGVTLTVVTLR